MLIRADEGDRNGYRLAHQRGAPRVTPNGDKIGASPDPAEVLMKTTNALLLAVLFAATPTLAPAAERGLAKAQVAGKAVAIDYGRPELKNRDMLAQAEVGKPWRLGADDPTTLKTEADLKFGSLAVPKGEYVLTATKVADGQWQLDFSKGGADKGALGSVTLTSQKNADSVEMFTIELSGKGSGGELLMKWGTTGLKTSFTGQ